MKLNQTPKQNRKHTNYGESCNAVVLMLSGGGDNPKLTLSIEFLESGRLKVESEKFYFHLYEAEFGERAVLGHSKVRSDRDGTIYLSLGERPVSRVRSVFAKQSTQARFTRTGQDRCHEADLRTNDVNEVNKFG